MSFSHNRAEIIGRVGRDASMRYTAEGQAVTTFSVATDRPAKAGAKAEPDWHSVVCWLKLAEFAASYVTKGRLVFVAGRIAYRSWEGRDGVKRKGTEIVASELILLDRKPDTETPVAEPLVEPELDSDVPF